MTSPASEVDAYVAALPGDQRAALESLRGTIRSAAPDATELISYNIPTFKLGSPLIAYAAAKNHCALYVMSKSIVDAFRPQLAGFDFAPTTIRFRPDQPIPASIVKAIVEARIKENESEAAKRRK